MEHLRAQTYLYCVLRSTLFELTMSFLTSACQRQLAKLMYRRGITYEQRQSYQQAIAALSSALDKGYPRPAEAFLHRGISQMLLQNRESAIADFELAICAKPNAHASARLTIAQAYFYKGKVYQQIGDEAAALVNWAKAIACCPTYSYPYYYRALLYIEKGDRDNALSDLNAALESYPTLASAYYQRGLLYSQSEDMISAINDLQCAVCNDFTLEAARQKLKDLQQNAYNSQLAEILSVPLAEKGLTVQIQHQDKCLNIQVNRAVGIGVNYYTLPDLIREHLVPLLLDGVSRFQLVGRVGEATNLEWNQSYDLYKNRPCPPSRWPAAIITMLIFPPFAVPTLIQAAWVKRAYQQGKYVEALSASKTVKVLSAASCIPFAFFMLLSISYSFYDFEQDPPNLRTAESVKVVERPFEEI